MADKTFTRWINEKYKTWHTEGTKNATEFARHVGVSQALMNAWLNGTRTTPTSQKEMGHNTLDVLERYLKIVEAMRADLSKMTSPMDKLELGTHKKTKLFSR